MNIRHDELKLSDRKWTCSKCGTSHDRDINAAINIYRAGRSITDMEDKALVSSYGSNETEFDEVSKKNSDEFQKEAHKSLACGQFTVLLDDKSGFDPLTDWKELHDNIELANRKFKNVQ